MKYLKYFEQTSDEIIEKIKNKFVLKLETEFSKYLEPAFIKIGRKILDFIEDDVKVFLLKPDFGVRITSCFEKEPNVIYANICVVFLENGKWKRSAYTKFYKSIRSQEKFHIESFVEKYVSELEIKYKNREKRVLKKNMKKFNI